MNIVDFNNYLKQLKMQNRLEKSFYDYCIISIRKSIINQFGQNVSDRLPTAARDVFNDKIYLKKETLKPVFAPAAFLKMITRNYIIDQLRKESKISQLINGMVVQPYYEENMDAKAEVKSAMKQLDPLSRKIVLLHYHHGFKYSEIEKITGIDEVKLRAIACKARKFLKSVTKKAS